MRASRKYHVGDSGKVGQGRVEPKEVRKRKRHGTNILFPHRVAAHATKTFLDNGKVTALIVGGPGSTKKDFLKDARALTLTTSTTKTIA